MDHGGPASICDARADKVSVGFIKDSRDVIGAFVGSSLQP